MKFILMMHARRGSMTGFDEKGNWSLFSWPREALDQHLQFLEALNADLKKKGQLVGISGLAPPGEARLVKARTRALPITDGPFPETREFLAGWWIVEVASVDAACEIAARASAAPGPDGAPLNMEIEVRQVM
jgi:hypothetical protein